MKHITLYIVIAGMMLAMACSKGKIKADLNLEERMQLGMKQFEKKKYLDAKNQFRIITLSYSGRAEAARAQYYLAECHYNVKEYILAGSEYERLIKVYPNSEWVDDAKYKLGMCYFKMSPKYSLDQEYTQKAIRQFQEFLEEFRNSPLVPEVEEKLNECRGKLARKVFSSAEQYFKMHLYEAAEIYYTLVLDNYYDSKYSPRAYYRVAECLLKMKKYSKALEAFQKVVDKFPRNDLAGKAREQIKALQATVKDS
ncbi:outer membrane protein assembly factor BamD [candidate division KSB1 bacterium]|nr:outer membrane protein assembly factor BamD [candidate division KSB1 bacterium]